MSTSVAERAVLRDLAKRVADIAAKPSEADKRRRWVAHNGLRDPRPMVVCFPEGAWQECIPHATIVCRDPILYGWEKRLRMAIFVHEVLDDDQVIDPVFNVPADVGCSDWGVSAIQQDAEPGQWAPENTNNLQHALKDTLASRSGHGASRSVPPLQELEDIERLRPISVVSNPDNTRRWLDMAQELFGDILPVRTRAWYWTGCSPAATAVELRGMEQLMLDFYDNPEWVHRLVKFLCDGTAAYLDNLEARGLLHLNNESEWVGTGGIGYTDELPAPGFNPNHVRLRDIWGMSQGQDLVGVSPSILDEFFMPYLIPVMERFGLTCYGCCEPMHDKLDVVMKIPHLRRLSVSPWADVRKCAEGVGNRCILSCKPNPTAISTDHVDETAMTGQMTEMFRIGRDNGCIMEVLMKDLHTVHGDTGRLRRWVACAKRARDQVWGG